MPSGVVVGAGGAPAARPRPPPPPPARIQMPEKSTLPSAVRGVAASRTGLPSDVRGIPGVGYAGHWAPSDGDTATATAITPMILNPHVITYNPPCRRHRIGGSFQPPWPARIVR